MARAKVAMKPPPGATAGGQAVKATARWRRWLFTVLAVVVGLVAAFWARYGSGRLGSNITEAELRELLQKKEQTLQLSYQLTKLTEVVENLSATGRLNTEAGNRVHAALDRIEGEAGELDREAALKIRWILSIVRGSLHQKLRNLTDEEVEAEGGAFTYANPRYWDSYYQNTTSKERFDWYVAWDDAIKEADFKPLGLASRRVKHFGEMLEPYLSRNEKPRVLIFGCGNSVMSERIYSAGIEDIVNIDISDRLLSDMRTRYEASAPQMQWLFMNASQLDFKEAQFDIVLDKGTLDSLQGNRKLLQVATQEAYRVLQPGALLLSISFTAPEQRLEEQLKRDAQWSECRAHEFVVDNVFGELNRGSQLHLYACLKP